MAGSIRPAQEPALRQPLAVFRLALISVCATLSVSPNGDPYALYVLLPLALGAFAAYRSESVAEVWPYVAALLCAGAVPFTGGGHSSLLPYLMASALSLGLLRGARELLLVCGSTSAVLLAGATLPGAEPLDVYFVGAAQWVVLALAVGLLPVWSRRLLFLTPADDYQEVRNLLQQVRNVTRHLPGSLDAASASQSLLDRCAQSTDIERSAVIAHPGGGVFVPLAVRGVTRVPWRTPLEDDGPLRQAWVSGHVTRDSREVDLAGRRRGSTVLAIPMQSRNESYALVVLESASPDGFPPDVVADLARVVSRAGPQLETAMLFEEVRLEASNEERDRLAREMHDGMAQELAVLGYQLDMVTQRAQGGEMGLGVEIAAVRGQLTALISELRLSITDLRTSLRPTRGLGVSLNSYLQAVCSGREVVLNLSLTESPFRLPPDQESGLLRAAQVFAQAVRRSQQVRELTVSLSVDPPSARLHLRCDHPLPDLHMDEILELAASMTGDVTLSAGEAGEPSLTITLKGADHDNPAAGGRPRVDPPRTAYGLRADR